MKRRTYARPALALAAALTMALAGVVTQSADAATTVTGHTGSGAPALAHVGDRLYVAWTGSTGTPAAKGLNFGYSSFAGFGKNIVKISNPEKSPQNEGPALITDPDAPSTGVVMVWPDARNGNTLTAIYYNGTGFTCRTSFTGLISAHTPSLTTDPSGKIWAAWTDNTGHLNGGVISPDRCDTTTPHTFVMSLHSQLSDTSVYGPSLTFVPTADGNHGLLLSWVADNPAHTINVANWGGATTLYNRTTVEFDKDVPPGVRPASAPNFSWLDTSLRLLYQSSDNFEYFSSNPGCVPACFHAVNAGRRIYSALGSAPGGPFGPMYTFFNATGNLVIADNA